MPKEVDMTTKRKARVLTRFLFLLLLGLAASVFASLAAHAYTGDETPSPAPVVRMLGVPQTGGLL
jgi:hypothetical protein